MNENILSWLAFLVHRDELTVSPMNGPLSKQSDITSISWLKHGEKDAKSLIRVQCFIGTPWLHAHELHWQHCGAGRQCI